MWIVSLNVECSNAEESNLVRGGVIFRKLNLFHDLAVPEMRNCFRSRWFSLPECLRPESVGPNVLYHQQSKRVALDDMTKIHTMLSGQYVNISLLLSARGVHLSKLLR